MTPITETIVIAILFCTTLMLLGIAFLVYMARGGRMFEIRVMGPAGTSIVIGESQRIRGNTCSSESDQETNSHT